jgi:FtsH-binding integral membrane protein
MSRYDDQTILRSRSMAGIDEGLRAFMVRVYMYMALGLSLTAAVAYYVASTPALVKTLVVPPLGYVFMFAPIGVVLFLSFRLHKIVASTAQTLFWAYAALMGISLSMIFLVYTHQSIAKIFFVSASLFGSMSLYGYTTQRDLTSMGSFMVMGLWGIILASIVNMFMQSGPMELVISVISVLIFTGLTAYDTQTIKEIYMDSDSREEATKKAVFGALQLYLDFVNIFLSLLRLFGERR